MGSTATAWFRSSVAPDRVGGRGRDRRLRRQWRDHHDRYVSGRRIDRTGRNRGSSAEEPEAESTTIAMAPAFTSEELNEHAGDNWITNGGGITNDRFSEPRGNQHRKRPQLKGDWMTKIGTDATAAKFSAEGQALEYEGTIYISDGADDVFAMDASTGEKLWTYEPHLPPDPLGEVVCCGWDNRGVAIGEGMVFVSQLNGDEVALDQETGKVDWSTNVENSRKGSRSPAPRSTTTARSTSAVPAASTASAVA